VGGGQLRPVLVLDGLQTITDSPVDAVTARAYNQNPTSSINRQYVCPLDQLCSDSILMGYALIGAGAGMQIRLVERARAALALTISNTFLGAFGGAQRGLVVDWDFGLLARVL